jgi:hypothetical protein
MRFVEKDIPTSEVQYRGLTNHGCRKDSHTSCAPREDGSLHFNASQSNARVSPHHHNEILLLFERTFSFVILSFSHILEKSIFTRFFAILKFSMFQVMENLIGQFSLQMIVIVN